MSEGFGDCLDETCTRIACCFGNEVIMEHSCNSVSFSMAAFRYSSRVECLRGKSVDLKNPKIFIHWLFPGKFGPWSRLKFMMGTNSTVQIQLKKRQKFLNLLNFEEHKNIEVFFQYRKIYI
jgi:hypothetical protein